MRLNATKSSNSSIKPGLLTCYCENQCPDGSQNGTCIAKPNSMCFAAIQEVLDPETGVMDVEWSYGCMPPDESGLMQCRGDVSGQTIKCCQNVNECNRFALPDYRPTSLDGANNDHMPPLDENLICLVIIFSITMCILLILIILTFLWIRNKKRERLTSRKTKSAINYFLCNQKMSVNGVKNDQAQSLIDQSSGSGSGAAVFVQRTISKQIQLEAKVGQGRFGEVWMGRYQGRKVAVKIFITKDEESWKRETLIYNKTLMRHESVLGFIASDINGTGSWTQMWLVTDFLENGSLYDFLQTNVVTPSQALSMSLSIADGVTYLHTEIFGTKGKPAMAHRDLKSKNILVKRDGMQCVIADFGLAVRFINYKVDIAFNTKQGTKRYMAPEVLNDQLTENSPFELFKMADMYSMGLVFWELNRRCVTGDTLKVTDEYQPPYYECVASDPSLEDMQLVVCVKEMRPTIATRWKTDPICHALGKIMQECWLGAASARLTAMRVKKTLGKMHMDTNYANKIV